MDQQLIEEYLMTHNVNTCQDSYGFFDVLETASILETDVVLLEDAPYSN